MNLEGRSYKAEFIAASKSRNIKKCIQAIMVLMNVAVCSKSSLYTSNERSMRGYPKKYTLDRQTAEKKSARTSHRAQKGRESTSPAGDGVHNRQNHFHADSVDLDLQDRKQRWFQRVSRAASSPLMNGHRGPPHPAIRLSFHHTTRGWTRGSVECT